MSFRSKFLCTFLCLSSLSGLVQANPYIIGQIGVAGWGDNNAYENLFDRYALTGVTGRLGLGYLWFVSPNVGLGFEAGLTLNQSATDEDYYANYELSRWSADVLAVADFYVSPNFDFFIKAGAAYVSQKFSMDYEYFSYDNWWYGTGQWYANSIEFNDRQVVPKLMIGMGYDVSSRVNVNFSLGQEFYVGRAFVPAATSAMIGLRCYFN